MFPNLAQMAVAAAASPIKKKLQELREVEGTDGPLCCFASSKVILCKLIGLFEPEMHLNTFLNSPEGKKLSNDLGFWGHIAAWGDATGHEEAKRVKFNNVVIPVIKKWAKGPSAASMRRAPLDFLHVWGDPAAADNLLEDGVPVMVCVTTPNTNHLVAIVRDRTGTNWLIDPWEKSDYASVVSLGSDPLFMKTITAKINAGDATIPAKRMFHGYFVQGHIPVKCCIGI